MKTNSVADYYHVTCRCDKCGKNQSIKVAEIASGQTHCRLSRLGHPPCPGHLEYYANDRETAVDNALSILGYLNWSAILEDRPHLNCLVDQVVDDIGCWSETPGDPFQMGWVGSNGLP